MTAQVLAIVIFIAMFVLIVSEKLERHIITLGCGLLTILLVFGVSMHSMDAIIETLNINSIITKPFWYSSGSSSESTTGINWETIIFIFGMMVMVEGMAKAGFFRWLCMKLAKIVNYKPIPLFIAFMIMSSLLAMFIDSITVILFLAAITIELAKLLKFDPVPMILSEIFCANLGGSATMCGDPPNIIIGTSFKYSFASFLTNTGLIAAICLVFIIIYFYIVYGRQIAASSSKDIDFSTIPEPKEAITNRKDFIISSLVFICAVVLLVTHSYTGLTVAFIGTAVATVTLIASGKNALELLQKVDFKTLFILYWIIHSSRRPGTNWNT